MKDLETKGYVIIPNFLDSVLLENLRLDYFFHKQLFLKTYDTSNNQAMIKCSYRLDKILNKVVLDIVKETNLNLRYPNISGAYFDNQINNFDWHQDHEPYFLYKDSYNAVNFWIPIIKESINDSGLKIIQHDSFKELCPEIFETRIKGHGAKLFTTLFNSSTLMYDDLLRTGTVLPFNINSIAITPELKEGDLLILRQDVIHKTQDTISDRVAVSVRSHSNTYKSVGTHEFTEYLTRKSARVD